MAQQQPIEQPIQDSLINLLGGNEQIIKIADRLIYLSIHDDRIKHLFKNTNIFLLKESLSKHLIQFFGGQNQYQGPDMRLAHKHLKLSEKDFQVFLELYSKTLKELQIDDKVINNSLTQLDQLKNEVLDK